MNEPRGLFAKNSASSKPLFGQNNRTSSAPYLYKTLESRVSIILAVFGTHLRLWAGTRRSAIPQFRSIMTISNDLATTTAPMKSSPQPTTVSNGVETPPNSRPKKLHGRAFYESIGSPRFVLAPMVDQSEFVSQVPILCPTELTSNRHGACSHAPSWHPTPPKISSHIRL